jgi:hypothetical protein
MADPVVVHPQNESLWYVLKYYRTMKPGDCKSLVVI